MLAMGNCSCKGLQQDERKAKLSPVFSFCSLLMGGPNAFLCKWVNNWLDLIVQIKPNSGKRSEMREMRERERLLYLVKSLSFRVKNKWKICLDQEEDHRCV